MDGDGQMTIGEALPDASVLPGSVQALDAGAADLVTVT